MVLGKFNENDIEILGSCLKEARELGYWPGDSVADRFVNRMRGEQHPRASRDNWRYLRNKVLQMHRVDLAELMDILKAECA